MATTIYLTEAFERLAAQIGPLAAKDTLEEWGFDGVLPYYGAKSLSSESEKIEPCEFHHLRIPIEPCVGWRAALRHLNRTDPRLLRLEGPHFVLVRLWASTKTVTSGHPAISIRPGKPGSHKGCLPTSMSVA